MKGLDFNFVRACAVINGQYYIKRRTADVKVISRSRKNGTITTSFCHALMRV